MGTILYIVICLLLLWETYQSIKYKRLCKEANEKAGWYAKQYSRLKNDPTGEKENN